VGYSGGLVDLSDHKLDHPAVYDLETLRIINRGKMKMMYNHRTPVGKTTRVENSRKKVAGEGLLDETNRVAKKITNAAKTEEFPFEMSMGLDARRIKLFFFPKGTIVNGRRFTKPMYVIKNAILDEMTITEQGRDSETMMRIKNSMFEVGELTRIKNAAKKPTKKVLPTRKRRPDPTPTPKRIVNKDKTVTKKKRPTTKRVLNKKPVVGLGTLTRLMNKYPEHAALLQKAGDEQWSPTRLKRVLHVRKLENQLPNTVKIGRRGKDDVLTLEARVLNACLPSKNREKVMTQKFGKKIAEQVMDSPTIGLKELLVEVAHRSGETGFTGHSDISRLMNTVGKINHTRLHMPERLHNHGGFSSIDMPNLFGRVTRVSMEEAWKIRGFMAKELCYSTSQSDFKPTQRFRPSGGTEWEGLDKDGRIKHASFGKEKSYLTTMDTKAQMLLFTREMIRNDDFGAIKELLNLMLEGALMVPDHKLVSLMHQARGTFFTEADLTVTAEGAYGTGNDYQNAAAALSETSLGIAFDLASEQVINKGKTSWINDIEDSWTLLVATRAQEQLAYDIVKNPQYVSNTTANTKQVRDNYWFGKFKVKRYTQLANKTFSANASRSAWFLLPSDPQYAPFSINWLDGQERPSVETVDAPVDMLGFGTRGWLDCDVNNRENEAIVRMRVDAYAGE